MEMLFVRGDGVILVRIFFFIVALLNTPYYSGITPFTYMTSFWQAISFDAVRFRAPFNLLRCEM